MEIVNYVKIDINANKKIEIPSVQFDTGFRWVQAQLLKNGIPLNLSGHDVLIIAAKPDGTEIINDCTMIDSELGLVKFEITEQMSLVHGDVVCQLKIYKDERLLSSKTFYIPVTKAICPKQMTSSNEYQTLISALNSVNGLKVEIQNLKTDYDAKFTKVNSQLSSLENLINQTDTKIENLKIDYNGKFGEVNNHLSSLENRVSENNTKIQNLKTDCNNKFNEVNTQLSNLENSVSRNESKINSLTADTTKKFTEVNAKVSGIESLVNPSHISVTKFGIMEGFNVDVVENTRRFQEMIDYCANDKVIVFPSGNYVFNSVNLGEKRNITIKGSSSPFASFSQKNIYTGAFIDEFTKIYCNAPSGETFFNHKSCVLILEDIAFYNVKKDAEGNFTQQEAKTNILMQHTRSEDATKNIEKGKVFCLNSAFYGWKVVFGSDFTFQHLEDEWGTGKVEETYEYFKQSCVVASRCRFTRNGIAVNQSVDGRLIDCSFNKNDYAIVLRENSGFTTISSCRIEWNNYNGIYCEKAHEVTVSDCEFDCNGHAGLYAVENTNSNFSGVFRRSGAKVPSDDISREDFINNVHIYACRNINCNFLGSNTTVKPISDVGSAPERPTNASNFSNNINCIITSNNLCGCTKKDKVAANKIEGNIDCIIKDNMMPSETTSVEIESLVLNETDLVLSVDELYRLNVSINPENATDKTIMWETSESRVATVDQTGKVTGVEIGEATITARSVSGNKTATCHVQVVR